MYICIYIHTYIYKHPYMESILYILLIKRKLTEKIVNSAPSNKTLLSTYASRPRTATARMSWTMRMAMKPLGVRGKCSRPASRTDEYLASLISFSCGSPVW